MFTLIKNSLFNSHVQSRSLLTWANSLRNAVDKQRVKYLGADRVCAEWVIRNGGAVRLGKGRKFISEYDELPLEEEIDPVIDIDGTRSSLMYNGFEHLEGCDHITTIVLCDCEYIDDQALHSLQIAKESLRNLSVVKCAHVTVDGLKSLTELRNLEFLYIAKIRHLKHGKRLLEQLKFELPLCEIKIE